MKLFWCIMFATGAVCSASEINLANSNLRQTWFIFMFAMNMMGFLRYFKIYLKS